MGATKKLYFITTYPLTDEQFYAWQKHHEVIKNWSCEPDDKEVFKDDPNYNKILSKYIKSKKELDVYQFNKRNK